MAKTAQKAATPTKGKASVPAVNDKRSQQRAVTASGGKVPAHLAQAKMTGAGTSQDASDLLIPMARVLQANSPEVMRGSQTQIPGAQAGDILIKNAPNPLIKGEQGFLFQPCYFQKKWVEWLPRNSGGGGGQGFVAMHDDMPRDTVSKKGIDPQNPDREFLVRPNGNIIVETRYHGGWLIDENGENPPIPLVIPFASTGHSVAKAWMMLMNNKQIDGQRADSCAVYYRFTTEIRTKGAQSWYVFKITDAGEEEEGIPSTFWVPTLEDLQRGQKLAQDMATGARTFDAAEGVERPAGDSETM